MVTLDELCAAMLTSGRPLTRRAARDWWTKGLLPRPRRRSLGRGKGTETYWLDLRVTRQAEAAHDFLARHSRTYSAGLSLWLLGFSVDLRFIRAVYQRLIGPHSCSIRSRSAEGAEGVVGEFAARLARQIAKTNAAPKSVQNAITDLISPFLEIFFDRSKEFDGYGLSEYWEAAAPYLGSRAARPDGLADISLQDNDFETVALYLGQMASLAAQRAAIASATDYELIRARRLVHLVFGHLGRLAQMVPDGDGFEDFCRLLLIVLGRPVVPILITVLRDETLRQKTVALLLDLAGKLRSGAPER